MNLGSTFLLRLAVILIGLFILALCVFVLPVGVIEEVVYIPFIAALYITAIPFFIALYHALRLLDYIDKNKAFSDLSVRALKNIKYCALIIGAIYTALLPLLYFRAKEDDAPGVLALGFMITFGSYVIAVFAAVLQKLLRSAIHIQSENDLTV